MGRTLSSPEQAAAWMKEQARALGLDAVGIARAGPTPDADQFRAALAAGRLAGVPYLDERVAERCDPRLLVPGARSVVVVAMGYADARPPRPDGPHLQVARYAARRDYHNPMIKKLRSLRRRQREAWPGSDAYVAADTGAVLERAWAQQAGLGWVGKNTMLLSTRLGSYTVLGSMVTTVELAPDAPGTDHCGTCTACLTACPTGALVAPHVLDARRCITTHTVENPGDDVAADAPPFHGWVFGCDVCQEVCPWADRGTANAALPARADLAFLPVKGLTTLDAAELIPSLAGTPLARAKVKGLIRNARARPRS
ncbi:MAG: tRNA epoxyqueuosine(34) reductase QueG [Deltaproteobacteria bacterium]|nr:tRNA epoxyqueuosine(34) reductase QueG [Deltaproteobacteria bacterium]